MHRTAKLLSVCTRSKWLLIQIPLHIWNVFLLSWYTQKKLRDRLQVALLTLSELINLRTITSIPPEIINKPTGVLMISGGWWKLINLLNNIRTDIWRRSLKTKREGKDKIASDHIYKIYINVFELFNRTDLDK